MIKCIVLGYLRGTSQNAEGVHTYVLKCWRGTCSSVRMLKGYMVRERLGTPDIDFQNV